MTIEAWKALGEQERKARLDEVEVDVAKHKAVTEPFPNPKPREPVWPFLPPGIPQPRQRQLENLGLDLARWKQLENEERVTLLEVTDIERAIRACVRVLLDANEGRKVKGFATRFIRELVGHVHAHNSNSHTSGLLRTLRHREVLASAINARDVLWLLLKTAEFDAKRHPDNAFAPAWAQQQTDRIQEDLERQLFFPPTITEDHLIALKTTRAKQLASEIAAAHFRIPTEPVRTGTLPLDDDTTDI